MPEAPTQPDAAKSALLFKAKTAMIYDQGEFSPKYFAFEQDLSRFNNVFVNLYDETASEEERERSEQLQSELNDFLYGPSDDDNDGSLKHATITQDEFAQAVRNGAQIVYCGFLP